MKKLLLYAACVGLQCLTIDLVAHTNELRVEVLQPPMRTWPGWAMLGLTTIAFAVQFMTVWKTADRTNASERRELLREIERRERAK